MTDILDALRAERDALNERMAADPRERTVTNARRRAALDRRVQRWTRQPPKTTRRQNVTANSATDHETAVTFVGPGTDPPGHGSRACIAPGCGKRIPETLGGRKVRADRETCSDACRQALARARRKATA